MAEDEKDRHLSVIYLAFGKISFDFQMHAIQLCHLVSTYRA